MDDIRKKQWEVYRNMSPEQKLQIIADLFWNARELKAAGLRMQHPDWDEARVQAQVTRIFLSQHDG